MNILLHGNMKSRRWLFKCKKCGCVFEANLREAFSDCYVKDDEVVKETSCNCPECHSRVISEDPEGYDAKEEDEPNA